MKQYNKFQLKKLKTSLEFGDVKKCADDFGVSPTTVQTALQGDAMTETHRSILDHLEFMVSQATDRKKRVYELGRAEFKRQKEVNP